jgi:hypothetical protein
LFFALESKFKGKGEFETTEAYNQRMETLLAQPVLGSLTPRSALTAVIGLTSGSKYSELTYDADAQQLSVDKSLDKVPFDLENYDRNSKLRVLPTGLDFEKQVRTYMGQNAFGRKARVVEKERYVCDLILLNLYQLGFKKGEYDELLGQGNIKFDLTMDPATAQKVKQSLKLLVIFQVGAPYVSTSKEYDSATIDNPVDLTTRKFFVYADVSEVWLYDSKTGEVYARFPAMAAKENQTSGSL